MHKLSVESPPKILVERYLIEIAKNYNVPYEPDAMVRVGPKLLFLSLISATSAEISHLNTCFHSQRCVRGKKLI